MTEWPRCNQKVVALFDVHAICELPLGHEYDGQRWHRAYDGMEWWMWEERYPSVTEEP